MWTENLFKVIGRWKRKKDKRFIWQIPCAGGILTRERLEDIWRIPVAFCQWYKKIRRCLHMETMDDYKEEWGISSPHERGR